MAILLNPEIRELRILGSRESIYGQLVDNNGEPVNLSGATIVCRIVKLDSGTVAVNNVAATIDSSTLGIVHYTPSALEAAAMIVGEWACYFIDTTATPNKYYPFDGPQRVIIVRAEY